MIVSLDCEGKWGMADHLAPYIHACLTDDALAAVYRRLVQMFASYDIPATFAYVMAFLLTPTERQGFGHLLERDGRDDPWMEHVWQAWEAGHTQGWFQPEALAVVLADGRHEVACHGFSHRSLADDAISAESAREELDAAQAVALVKGVELKTLVYPRNQVGHRAILRDNGFIGYREKLSRPGGALGRIYRLAEEFNVAARAQKPEFILADGLVPIPPGFFFNWQFGSRRLVPGRVTVTRWKNLLDAAASDGGVVHLWLHPHNLITAPQTGDNLARVLAHAALLRDRGSIEIITQEQYCQRLSATQTGAAVQRGMASMPMQ